MQSKRSSFMPWILCLALLCLCAVSVFQLQKMYQRNHALQDEALNSAVCQSQLDSLNAEHLSLTEAYDALLKSHAALEESLTQSRSVNQRLDDEVTDLKSQLLSAQTDLAQYHDELSGYQEQYTSLEQYVVSLEGILESYAADPGVDERLDVITDLQKRLAQSETNADHLRNRVSELEEQLTNAEQSYAGAYALMQESTLQADAAIQTAKQMEEEFERMQAELSQTQTVLAETEDTLAQTKNELDDSQTQLLQSQNASAAMSEQLASNEVAMNAYEADADAMRKEIQALQDRLTEAEQNASGNETLLSEAKMTAAALETEMADLAAENETLQTKLEALQKQPSSGEMDPNVERAYLVQIAQLEARLSRTAPAQYELLSYMQAKELERMKRWQAGIQEWLQDILHEYEISTPFPYAFLDEVKAEDNTEETP